MTSRKRNEFLETDTGDEGDESQGYKSDDDDFKKGGRGPKRRKVESDGSDDEHSVGELEERTIDQRLSKEPVDLPSSETASKPPKQRQKRELPGISNPLSKKNLVATAAAIKRSGVVYLSRIPPFMKPQKLRSLLEPYGAINRIFLTPEDPASHTRRVRNGGNKKRSFCDGWVEFMNKADAKKACELLNTRIIGGKKGTYYHDDVWNLLYLNGFKWNNLTEQIAAENAERSSRMRAEISKTTRENKEFVQNVERAKMLEGMETKRANKRKKEEGSQEVNASATVKGVKKGAERSRRFKQTPVATKTKAEDQPEQVKRVLSKIF